MRRALHPLSLILVTAVTGLSACAVNDAEAPAADWTSVPAVAVTTAEQAVLTDDAPPTATTLAAVRLSLTHTVMFLERSDGELEALEQLHADLDRGRPSLAAIDPASGITLAALHQRLLPNAPVPASLVAADQRRAARPPAEIDPTPPDDADNLADVANPAGSVAGWDWAADADWFWQSFYNGGQDGYFAANSLNIWQTKKRVSGWYKASAFNQSFEGAAWFRVKRSYSCNWYGTCSHTVVNQAVPNRIVTTYLVTDGLRWRQSWMDGSGTNPRVGLAVRWTWLGSLPLPWPWG
jgi:hypothetical protein